MSGTPQLPDWVANGIERRHPPEQTFDISASAPESGPVGSGTFLTQGVRSPGPTSPRGGYLKRLASRPHIAGLKGGLDDHQPYYAQDRSKGREAQYEPQFEQAEIALRQWRSCSGGLKG